MTSRWGITAGRGFNSSVIHLIAWWQVVEVGRGCDHTLTWDYVWTSEQSDFSARSRISEELRDMYLLLSSILDSSYYRLQTTKNMFMAWFYLQHNKTVLFSKCHMVSLLIIQLIITMQWVWALRLLIGFAVWALKPEHNRSIRHVNNIPTMQFFTGISRNNQIHIYDIIDWVYPWCIWDFQNNAF